MHPTNVELLLTTTETSTPIRNLWAPYVHDVSAYDGTRPNRHGVLAADDVEAWSGPGDWWSKPEVLFPYLILVDGNVAGFNLIASGPHVPTPGIDFVVYEFFVAHAFRGTTAASRAAQLGIARHPGAWEVVTYPGAARPIAFWRKVLPPSASGPVSESEEDHPWGRKIVFRFVSNQG